MTGSLMSMNPDVRYALTFDDILLIPQYSEITPSEIVPKTFFARDIYLNAPILSAAMDTVTEHAMAIVMAEIGGFGVIHKNLTIEKQVEEVLRVKKYHTEELNASVDKSGKLLVGAAVGVGSDSQDRIKALVLAGADIICVDTAHGHSKNVIETVKHIAKNYPQIIIVAGNIVTGEAVKALVEAGADVVKVGVGPGSICTTRMVAGVGMPQISAVQECSRIAKSLGKTIISDGGIKLSGDMTKALALGANIVMVGNLLAGTDESPGEIFEDHGRKYKSYRGMGSLGAMAQGSKDRYGQMGVAEDKLVPEGVEGKVLYKGSARGILHQLLGGVRSGMGYLGAANIEELQKRAHFVQISPAGLRESHVHDVMITKKAPNYRGE